MKLAYVHCSKLWNSVVTCSESDRLQASVRTEGSRHSSRIRTMSKSTVALALGALPLTR